MFLCSNIVHRNKSIYLTLCSIDTHFNASTTQLLKTLWVKKKLLVMSNFFFSHNVFYSIRTLYPYLMTFLTSYLTFAAEMEEPKIGM